MPSHQPTRRSCPRMPEYRIPVNPSNPGQYFACCGLFELAELAAPGGEALFEGGSVFALNTDALMPPQRFELLPHLGDERYEVTLEPLDFSFFGRVLKLNWWLNETLTGKSRLKTRSEEHTSELQSLRH